MFRGDLRRAVIFGRNDLVQDAPISRLDLLVCRNTLMYFNAEAQAKILARFHFALNGDGRGNGIPVPRPRRDAAHARQPVHAARSQVPHLRQGAAARAAARAGARRAIDGFDGGPMDGNQRLRDLALEESPLPRIVVDANNASRTDQARARAVQPEPQDIGRPLQDLEISYRPDRPALAHRAGVRRAAARSPRSVERRFPSGEPVLRRRGAPLFDDGRAARRGDQLPRRDAHHALQDELRARTRRSRPRTRSCSPPTRSWRPPTRSCQSTNEELETTNEELQSTNEELETMNEELQSTNEELQTVNEELRTRSEELNHVNAFFESVLASLSAGAVVVNHDMNVLMWNHRAQDLWGLRADEVQGKSLPQPRHRPAGARAARPVRACLAGDSSAARSSSTRSTGAARGSSAASPARRSSPARKRARA